MLANGMQVAQGHSKRTWMLWFVRYAKLYHHVPCMLRCISLCTYLHATMHIIACSSCGMHRRTQNQHCHPPCIMVVGGGKKDVASWRGLSIVSQPLYMYQIY